MTDQRLTVLVVDDEVPQLDDLARLLRKNPRVATVDVAPSARDALLALTSRSFDVILIDVRMPGLNGFELAEVLHLLPGAPALVFISASDASAAATFGFRAVDFLLKPITPARLDEALARVLAGTRAAGDMAVTPQHCGTRRRRCVLAVRDLGGNNLHLLARTTILYLR
ncbi:MAG TPA: response regulator, partial [Mycobacteriales bacterium]|nr:response regulator [Mycobacteriales bacterium]